MSKLTHIPPAVFQFLRAIEKNNNRDWFQANKEKYVAAKEQVDAFAKSLLDEVSHHDEIESMRTYRIYRDVRFSKNKTPYKNNFSGGLKRATKWKRGGCYFHIQPGGKSFVGGGFWGPNANDLARLRQEFAVDPKPLRKIINTAGFKKNFGMLQGEQVKTAPRGFSKDHPSIDLLKFKQFLLYKNFTDKEVTTPGFAKKMSNAFKAMRPFFDYMSEVLTTDENGVPIE
jgi:uncharacterized protein (TIGR02453 family)